MTGNNLICASILAVAAFAPALHAGAGLEPAGLKTEYLTNPLGIDVGRPRLSWILTATERAQKQSAYEVVVAASERALQSKDGALWDSGKVASDQTFGIEYRGPALRSGTRCFWKVRVWSATGSVSRWSPVAWWQMALLNSSDWQGRWIGAAPDEPSPLLRKEFAVHKKVARATAYVFGLGWYELRLNGRKVGEKALAPVNSKYNETLYYDTLDVTAMIGLGANAAGLWLGNGYNKDYSRYGWRWMESKRAILQLDILFADGSRSSVVTDSSWKTAPSPITSNDIYNGETYDARLEKPAWDAPGYDDRSWAPAAVLPSPAGAWRASMTPAIQVTETIRPAAVTQPRPGVYVFDLAQNISGWIRLRVRGNAGNTVVLRHAEDVQSDGTLDTKTNRRARATDTYILKGGADEVYEPRFTYHGFRYVEVTGFPGVPTLQSIEGRAVHSAVEATGTFSSSNPLIDKIHRNFRWSILNNLMAIPTDTPTRDERTPCQMDSVVIEDSAVHMFGMDQFYTKWLRDIAGEKSIPVWSSDQVFLPMLLYQQYGDRRILEENWDNIKHITDHFTATAAGSKYWQDGFGDWCPPRQPGNYKDSYSEGELVDTAVYYRTAVLAARIAEILGAGSDRARYMELARAIQTAFQAKHFHAASHTYGSGRQVTSILPLAFDMVPEESKGAVAEALADKLMVENSGHLDTGIFGTRYLFDVLIDNGYADAALTALTRTDYPSYGHQISLGATTTWEQWVFGGGDMITHDHAMFAGPGTTLYTRLAGIRPASPGYRTITIRPYIPKGLTRVSASLRTVVGEIVSEWDTAGGYTHRITVPANTTAEVYVPAQSAASVTESGRALAETTGVKFLRMEAGCVVLSVASGKYSFSVAH